jgi:hypothetical protein
MSAKEKKMNQTQQALVLQILLKLGENDTYGEWPELKCTFRCNGSMVGYYDSCHFEHGEYCVSRLFKELQETTWEEQV